MTFKGKAVSVQREKGAEEGYDMYASSYVSDEKKLNVFDQKMLLRHVRLLGGKEVLDAGCGTGRLAWLFRKRSADMVTGFDISQNMLDIAEKTGVYKELVQADITQELPFEWNAFDTVFCAMVLVHVSQTELPRVMEELLRVLKPGGMIFIVNLAQRRAPMLRTKQGESLVIRSHIHADRKVMDAMEDVGFINIASDKHEENGDSYASLIIGYKAD